MAFLTDSRMQVGRPTRRRVGLLVAASAGVQAVVSWLIWLLVDDWSGASWSTRDFTEWLLASLALAALVAAVGGLATRRWWVTSTLLIGCMLATGLGYALFIGYAVVNSA